MIIGVVGKTNTGKSTFFKAATLAEVEIENRPFVTIKPNLAIGYVKVECVDKEFNTKCNPKFGFCIDHERFIPVKLIDVAGLVPGAHLGKGLGLTFLDDLREADVLIHVIDISGGTNEKGEPVEKGSYDPGKDIEFLEKEIDMWYYSILKRGWDKFSKQIMQEKKEVHKELAKQLSALKVTEEMVKSCMKELGLSQNPSEWKEEDLMNLAFKLRRITKPMIIAANKIDVPGAYELFLKVKERFKDVTIIPCSAESELALREAAKSKLINYVPGESDFEILKPEILNEKQKKALEFIKKNVLEKYGKTGVQEILNKAVFELLGYIVVYPVANETKLTDAEGNILPDAFLLPKGSTVIDLAYKIHSDIGEKFNCAIDVRTKKRLGKDYVLKNGDVIKIMTS